MGPGSVGLPGCGSSRGSQDGRASMADGLRDESDEEKDARCVKLPKLGSDAAAAAAEEFEEEQRKEQMMALLGNIAALATTTTTRRTPTVITTPRNHPGPSLPPISQWVVLHCRPSHRRCPQPVVAHAAQEAEIKQRQLACPNMNLR